MLKGKVVTLRPIEEGDLKTIYHMQLDVEARGQWFPRGVESLRQLHKDYEEHGFWGEKFGSILIVDNNSAKIIGQMFYFNTVDYMSELEIGYIVFDTNARKKGATTEALKLLTDHLFDVRPVNRIRLVIATENVASRRVAEKNGYVHEGTMRGGWFNGGRGEAQYIDGELYAITRQDLK
jgi:[ribosomal protein S5]-alanine N-acetyltransferase